MFDVWLYESLSLLVVVFDGVCWFVYLLYARVSLKGLVKTLRK